MLDITLATADPHRDLTGPIAVPVPKPESDGAAAIRSALLDGDLRDEAEAFVEQAAHTGKAGEVQVLPRPRREPSKIFFIGVGDDDEAGWRALGAAIVRSAAKETSVTIEIAAAKDPAAAVRGVAEGAWLAAYRFRLSDPKPASVPTLASLRLIVEGVEQSVLETARVVAEQTCFARDLTNMPSSLKTPQWFVDQIAGDGLTTRVWTEDDLADEGFNGILAVGKGSDNPPRLLQVEWAPPGAIKHIVLVGKGITFDTGGVDVKPADAMILMRKDMGGGAAVAAATIAAAKLNLPVRVTTLIPVAENMISGTSWRQGDIVRHYGGLTTEVRSTDAEGRVVVGDALAYAVEQFDPDYLIDLATLTGANRVALGKKIGALFGENETLVKALTDAATAAGEQLWQLPLPSDYLPAVVSEIADLYNSTETPAAATITAALYLREFVGDKRDIWAHIDMSSPSWADSAAGELTKGATGFGVRTLVRFMESI